jgi:murein DD-endopeptidase MepM/ murein hydrolase activator NlpD
MPRAVSLAITVCLVSGCHSPTSSVFQRYRVQSLGGDRARRDCPSSVGRLAGDFRSAISSITTNPWSSTTQRLRAEHVVRAGTNAKKSGQTDGHNGYDWRMAEGTPILAVADGW